MTTTAPGFAEGTGWHGVVGDWSADKQTFEVPWGKAMMWIFLLSDTFIFSCFLISYMKVRVSIANRTFSAQVPLQEGNNTITAVARDPLGSAVTDSIQVTLDTTAPAVNIDFPSDGFVTAQDQITVTGMINDIVVGTVNGDQAQVTVNGVTALVSNRSFLAVDVLLTLGENLIEAVGTDRAGNTGSASISVIFEPLVDQQHIALVSGNNQSGFVGSELTDDLVVPPKLILQVQLDEG